MTYIKTMQTTNMQYVLGFLFNENLDEVALIKKTKPKWQAGKINGIGGKIEFTDINKSYAMSREFEEETGVKIFLWDWIHYTTLSGPDWDMYCFTSVSNEVYDVKTTTEEEVIIIKIKDLHNYPHIDNVSELIKLAIDYIIKSNDTKNK